MNMLTYNVLKLVLTVNIVFYDLEGEEGKYLFLVLKNNNKKYCLRKFSKKGIHD